MVTTLIALMLSQSWFVPCHLSGAFSDAEKFGVTKDVHGLRLRSLHLRPLKGSIVSNSKNNTGLS